LVPSLTKQLSATLTDLTHTDHAHSRSLVEVLMNRFERQQLNACARRCVRPTALKFTHHSPRPRAQDIEQCATSLAGSSRLKGALQLTRNLTLAQDKGLQP
jgi:hypothetical protein